MCDRKPGKNSARQIDPCLLPIINRINSVKGQRTIASCCGHGRYCPTILIENIDTGEIHELYSHKKFNGKYNNGKKRKRFYKYDKRGYYYLPGVHHVIFKDWIESTLNLITTMLEAYNDEDVYSSASREYILQLEDFKFKLESDLKTHERTGESYQII